jgi:hypothetical protein
MALYFQNSYAETVWIAFLWYDGSGSCTPPFLKQGWWAVQSGQSFNLWNTSLANVGPAAFYAEEFKDSGGATWSGTGNNWYWIQDQVFGPICYSDDQGANQQVDFVPLDFQGYCNATVVLGPAAGQWNIVYSPCVPMLTAAWVVGTQGYTTFTYSGSGFPSNITVELSVVGMTGRTAPLSIGFQNTDANGNFSSAYSYLCQNSAPSPSAVVQAYNETRSVLFATSAPFSLPCSF